MSGRVEMTMKEMKCTLAISQHAVEGLPVVTGETEKGTEKRDEQREFGISKKKTAIYNEWVRTLILRRWKVRR